MVFELKNIKEGIFIARTELWHEHNSNPITVSWTSENNGRDDGRQLKKAPPPLPDDYAIEVAVNGVIQYRVDEEGFKAKCDGEISYNVQICVLVDDLQLASTNENQDMEVAIRVAGGGREAVLGISHVYYA